MQVNSKRLYETDFNLWIDETVKQLKAGKFHEVDLDNLIEELEAMVSVFKKRSSKRNAVIFKYFS